MLEFLRGRLVRRSPTELVLDVGGVGFRIMVSTATSQAFQAKNPGDVIELLTHLQLGATDPFARIFGFSREAERTLFDLLTSVKGVGPGTALRILSGASVEDLRDSILSQDRGRLTRVKGIGPKSAERILLELREKISVISVDDLPALQPEEANKVEAVTAMVSLGFDSREARKSVEAAIKKLGDRAAADELVRQALQEATR